MMQERKYYVLNYIFILNLLILFINDQFLKFYFSNWLTGKLSDFAGIIILHLLISYFFPKNKLYNLFFVIVFFIFLKTPFSDFFIKIYNWISPIRTERIVDYTDFIAFLVLPFSYYFVLNIDRFQTLFIKRLNAVFILFPTFIILLSEAPPLSHYYTYSDGDLKCYKCHTTFKLPKDEIIKRLNDRNINFYENKTIKPYDTWRIETYDNYTFYKIDQFIIERDTLKNIDFYLAEKGNKTDIYFNGMSLPKGLSNKEVDYKIRKYYKKMIFEELKENLK